ncbi:MAG TPA: pyridoxal-phosphate dependent enzyme [Polyangiaceae bacterium]|nr:pyridoxal-phosphate dependent enzyme [Polyangiaceae bacterium]
MPEARRPPGGERVPEAGQPSGGERVPEAGRPSGGERVPEALRPAKREPLLFGELPELARLPFLPLLHGPTPVEPMRGLEGYFGRGGLWVKRDDLASPLYGGNKVRKFEFLLADALDRGARGLWTVGGLASTQVTATALFGRALGLPVRALLFDQAMTRFGRHALLADRAAGAELIYGGPLPLAALSALGEAAFGPRGYALVAPGASTPRPNAGFVDGAFELAEQVRRGEMPRPDAVVVPAGSGGTVAGLALGFAYLGWPTEVIGVRITSRLVCHGPWVRALGEATARALERAAPRFGRPGRGPLRLRVEHRAAGRGYGEPTAEAREGARRLVEVTGYEGEVTYSGKALAALRRLAAEPEYARKTLLFWNTLTRVPPPAEGVGPSDLSPPLRRRWHMPLVA